jgi:hypothetical protein
MHLSEFLATHPPDTDLRVVSWQSDEATHVRCVLRTSPWWVPADQRAAADGTLVIDCRGVVDSEIRVGERPAEVEDLEVLEDAPPLWAYGEHASIYGSAPLPDPDRFFAHFSDLVQHRLRTHRGTAAYLGGTADAWRRRVTSAAAHLLLQAPARIVDACLPLLDQQQAKYTVTRSAPRAAPALRFVVIGESWIICREAMVKADPPPG